VSQDAAEPLADGRYRLVEVLGEGGMAIVYRAYDERLQVYRAIKVLSAALARHPTIRERFLNEARTMARLHHPNIVGVHDVVQQGEQPYIVMELVQGGSLMDHLSEHGVMQPRMALDCILALLGALGVAHEAGVIHRDIKPQNILVTAKGKPKVTDFGIAHVVDDNSDRSLTKTGSVMGTWGFMAPEQRVSARKVDGRSDLYAVGATLYTLLTNEMPVDLFAAEMDDTVLHGIEPALAAVIRKATRYRPDDRYADVEEMEDALRRVRPELPELQADTPRLGGGALTDRPTPPPSRETRKETSHTMVPDGEYVVGHTGSPGAERAAASPAGTASETMTWELGGPAEGGVQTVQEDATRAPPPAALEAVKPSPEVPSMGTLHDGLPGGHTELDPNWDDAPLEERRSLLPLLLGGAALLVVGFGAWTLLQPDDAPVEEPVVEQPETTAIEEPVVEEPVVEEPVVEEPVVEEPVVEERPVVIPVRDPVVAEVEEPVVEEPVAEEPVVEEPAAPVDGVVSVEGDALKVLFEGSDGKRRGPGPLAPGDYVIVAAFSDGVPHTAGKVTVSEGKTVTVVCNQAFAVCKPR
jgi:tRNA A-37 threonylcarbamoyl transferase component Bud32